MKRFYIRCSLSLLFFWASGSALANCLPVGAAEHGEAFKIANEVLYAMSERGLKERDFYQVMRIVARYETNDCWSGATGNSDEQWLSVGVMQWNLGQGTLQPILSTYKQKFADSIEMQLQRLMPKYGEDLFRHCGLIPITPQCKQFLRAHYGPDGSLLTDFKNEVEELFDSDAMRQIQVDRFGRTLTSVLDKVDQVFGKKQYAAWQIAWAMDLKTQQGKFPTDLVIRSVRGKIRENDVATRRGYLLTFISWYEAESKIPYTAGVTKDWDYNVKTWRHQVGDDFIDPDREEVLHYTFLASRTAVGKEGFYQADAFQRRATIAFGKGSVHGNVLDLMQDE